MHLDAAAILSLLSTYGYPALGVLVAVVAAGVPIPFPMTTTFVALGALTTTPHGPNFLALALVATLAAAVGHSADYGLGRSGSPLARRWRGRLERRIGGQTLGNLERRLARSSTLVILLTRFPLTPLASPASLVAGLMRVAYRRFLVLELIGKATYFTTCLTLGRLLGPAMTHHFLLFALCSLLVTLLLLTPVALLHWRSRRRSGPQGSSSAMPEETAESVGSHDLT
jgi:membrane protein DedA with SNARE-associated domain